MSSNTEYLNTERADVPIVTATGEKISTFAGGAQPGFHAQSGQDSTGIQAAMARTGAHTTHIEHDAPHTAQEKPSLPRNGGF